MHPLRARRTHVVILLTCVVAGIAGWLMATLGASRTADYAVLCSIVAVGTFVAVTGALRIRRDD